MNSDRARELAEQAWNEFSANMAWNTLDAIEPIRKAILQAVAEQKEMDAKICDAWDSPDANNDGAIASRELAAAIRRQA